VRRALKVLCRIGLTILAVAVSFFLGSYATAIAYSHWGEIPLSPQDPQYGQLDFVAMLFGVYGGAAIAFVVLVVGIIWSVKAHLSKRRPEPRAADGLPGA
jgi:choline-glycine betaine transporter